MSYKQAANWIVFDLTFLDAAPKLGNRTTFPSVIALCDDLLADLALSTGAAGKVRSMLLRDVANRPTLAKVAKLLKSTPRATAATSL